ncbi:hypothetical protein LG293_17950 (plasmid) [Citricoccus nitrophenolicus]
MPTTIWPDRLERGRHVEAISAGHVIAIDRRTLPGHADGHALGVIPRTPGLTIATRRLRSAAKQLGYEGWESERYRDQQGQVEALDIWDPSGSPENRITLVEFPTGPGTLSLACSDDGPTVRFRTPLLRDDPHTWTLISCGIPDYTPEASHLADPDIMPDWDIADRDRWLHWVGLRPA